jgi:hypothetical protein
MEFVRGVLRMWSRGWRIERVPDGRSGPTRRSEVQTPYTTGRVFESTFILPNGTNEGA